MPDKHVSIRTTISVPAELKSRMDQIRESVNWSALACQAFENKLAEIAARTENKTMNDVVERLRASLRSEQGKSFNDGYEVGARWAENTAAAAELARLYSFQKSTKTKSQHEWGRWFRQSNRLPWFELVKIIRNNKNLRPPTVAAAFWKTLLGETSQQPSDGDFLRGFVEGAVDLWTRVQEKL